MRNSKRINIFLKSACIAALVCSAFNLDAQKAFAPMRDGTRIHYYIVGNKGDTLLFLHGGPGQNSKGVAPDLIPLAKSHVLIVYDQRGCGLSELGDTIRLNPDTHAGDLEDLRKFFGIRQMTLVGHSWGCMLAILYNNLHADRVKRLLLLSPGPPTRQLFRQRFITFLQKDSSGQATVARARSRLETTKDPLSVCREINDANEQFYFFNSANIKKRKGDYCDVPAAAILKQAITARLTLQALGDYDLLPLIAKTAQPTLVIEGAQTPVPIEELQTWAKTLPTGKLLLIDKTGHGYPFVENPDTFFKAVEEFLDGKWPSDAKILK